MNFPKIPFNKTDIFLKHVLYNGCIIYVPLEKEEDRPKVKAQLRAFNSQQMADNPQEPEYA